MRAIRNNKKNNKGFSLVELIIVIAIMAVLVGTLAPQYLRYVEKSRLAADQTLEEQFITSLQILAADPEAKLDTTQTYSITSDTSGTIEISPNLKPSKEGETKKDNLYAEFIDVNKKYSYKSETYTKNGWKIELTYNGTVWVVTSGENITEPKPE